MWNSPHCLQVSHVFMGIYEGRCQGSPCMGRERQEEVTAGVCVMTETPSNPLGHSEHGCLFMALALALGEHLGPCPQRLVLSGAVLNRQEGNEATSGTGKPHPSPHSSSNNTQREL